MIYAGRALVMPRTVSLLEGFVACVSARRWLIRDPAGPAAYLFATGTQLFKSSEESAINERDGRPAGDMSGQPHADEPYARGFSRISNVSIRSPTLMSL